MSGRIELDYKEHDLYVIVHKGDRNYVIRSGVWDMLHENPNTKTLESAADLIFTDESLIPKSRWTRANLYE